MCVVGSVRLRCVSFCFSRVCVFAFCLSPFVRACCIHVLFLCVCFRVHVSFFVCVRVCNSFGVCACVCNFIWRVQLLSVCVQFTFSFRFVCVCNHFGACVFVLCVRAILVCVLACVCNFGACV